MSLNEREVLLRFWRDVGELPGLRMPGIVNSARVCVSDGYVVWRVDIEILAGFWNREDSNFFKKMPPGSI